MPISLCMRYGIHTFTLLVEPLAPFSNITAELLFAIRDRDPDNRGLLASPGAQPVSVPPEGHDVHISYGVLKDPNDSEKGWKDLKIEGGETPVSKGLRNNSLVAFVIRGADEADEAPEFVAQWPQLNEPDEVDEDEDDGPDSAGNGRQTMDDDDDDDDLDM